MLKKDILRKYFLSGFFLSIWKIYLLSRNDIGSTVGYPQILHLELASFFSPVLQQRATDLCWPSRIPWHVHGMKQPGAIVFFFGIINNHKPCTPAFVPRPEGNYCWFTCFAYHLQIFPICWHINTIALNKLINGWKDMKTPICVEFKDWWPKRVLVSSLVLI